jgi:hypothetical protein
VAVLRSIGNRRLHLRVTKSPQVGHWGDAIFNQWTQIMENKRLATRPGRGMHGVIIAMAFFLAGCGSAYAQAGGIFARLAGEWNGNGTIELADGSREPLRCRAAYDVLDGQSNLQLNIRCASDSFSFDLRGSATLAGSNVRGIWSESTRNAGGKISGTAHGDKIEVVAESSAFTAGLSLTTRGNKQSVTIKSKEANSSLRGATINLQRSGSS